MRIYIATPINARKEETFELKCEAANARCEELRRFLSAVLPKADVFTPFDVNPIGGLHSEEEALGRCIYTVLMCDAVYFDEGWKASKGCQLEHSAAELYEKSIIYNEDVKVSV